MSDAENQRIADMRIVHKALVTIGVAIEKQVNAVGLVEGDLREAKEVLSGLRSRRELLERAMEEVATTLAEEEERDDGTS